MSHTAGVLGWPEPMPPAAKYAITYLFAQAEFGLLCPVSMTDTLTRSAGEIAVGNLICWRLRRHWDNADVVRHELASELDIVVSLRTLECEV